MINLFHSELSLWQKVRVFFSGDHLLG